jgi:hypothetical protein
MIDTHPETCGHPRPEKAYKFVVLLSSYQGFRIMTRSMIVKNQILANVRCPKPNDVPNINMTLARLRRTTT